MITTYGQIAYEAFRARMWHLPDWDDLTGAERDAWKAAETAVRRDCG